MHILSTMNKEEIWRIREKQPIYSGLIQILIYIHLVTSIRYIKPDVALERYSEIAIVFFTTPITRTLQSASHEPYINHYTKDSHS